MPPTILQVNRTDDRNDGNLADGLSLREAILIANANPDTEYEISLTGGLTYTLTANGINEDGGRTGDLDIAARNNVLTIGSFDGQKATIDASGLLNSDRVFQVLDLGKLSLQNVVVTGGKDSSSDFQAAGGGGIRANANSFVDVVNSIITNNIASSYSGGGGILNRGTFYLRNSTVSNNLTNGLDRNGGGILNSGTLIAIDTTIDSNTSGDGGGIYNFETLTLLNTTIINNSSNEGGGIQSNGGSVALLNTTVSSNESGGISMGGGGVLNLFNSTITNNTTTFPIPQAAGIYNNSGTVNLKNTIVAGNIDTNNNNKPFDLASGFNTAIFNGNSNNLIGEFSEANGTIGTGTDIVTTDPQLSPLQNNGGLTLSHIPLDGSPAIDAGNNSLIPADGEDLDGDGNTTEQISFDQRSLARISNGTVDIGAVEFGSTLVTLPNENDAILDVDGSGDRPTLARDGLLISAFLFFYKEDRTDYSILDKFILDPNATRTRGNDIANVLKDELSVFDADGSGQTTFSRDGLLISAFLFFYKDDRTDYSVLDKFILDANATLKTGDDVANYLKDLMGINAAAIYAEGTEKVNIQDIFGTAGNDFMTGNSNNDRIFGNTGDDLLTGGSGKDTFVFEINSDRDLIADFTVLEDLIQLDPSLGFSDSEAVFSAINNRGIVDDRFITELSFDANNKITVFSDRILTADNFSVNTTNFSSFFN
jgi:RTX calcium-binding nonapeptide repeat (4 copies)